jgi:copper(I)-binding protein
MPHPRQKPDTYNRRLEFLFLGKMLMKKSSFCWAALAAILFSTTAYAGDIQIEKARVRATAPGQETAMVDMQITSKQAGRLVGVTTPAAKSVELHRMSHDNGMMKMREVQDIALPAGQIVDLGAAGFHLMLVGLKAQIKEGTSVPLTLTIQLGNKKTLKVETTAEVKPLVEIKADANEHEHMHHHH